MEAQKQSKLFAFKLAAKQAKEVVPADQWKVREGVSAAGCSGPDYYENYRETATLNPRGDNGIYC